MRKSITMFLIGLAVVLFVAAVVTLVPSIGGPTTLILLFCISSCLLVGAINNIPS